MVEQKFCGQLLGDAAPRTAEVQHASTRGLRKSGRPDPSCGRGGGRRRAARGSEVTLKALKDTTAEDVVRSEAIALGSWVEGFVFFNVGPAKAALAEVKRLPVLGGKPVAVFCTYGFNPRATLATLRQSLEAKGAKVVAENASPRSHPDRGADELAKRLCASLGGS